MGRHTTKLQHAKGVLLLETQCISTYDQKLVKGHYWHMAVSKHNRFIVHQYKHD